MIMFLLKKKLNIVKASKAPIKNWGILDAAFVYKKGSDVQQTWRKYGWTAPSEYRNDFEFKKNREGIV
jgi:hypothetical protein